MAQYIICYQQARAPQSEAAGAAQMARWQAWINLLGDALINPGTPLAHSKTVSAEGVRDGGNLTGFSVILADNMEAALAMAQACPYLEVGTLEVAEMKEM